MSPREQCVGATDEWYTPPYVFEALGTIFDTDVASPGGDVTPWIPARAFYTSRSLENIWCGFVWCNPPFGGRNAIYPWLRRFTAHGNGIALTPDRTSAPWWQRWAPEMDAILFVSPKIKFIGRDGLPGKQPAQGTTLMALGTNGVTALRRAAIAGLGIVMRSGWPSIPMLASTLANPVSLIPAEPQRERAI